MSSILAQPSLKLVRAHPTRLAVAAAGKGPGGEPRPLNGGGGECRRTVRWLAATVTALRLLREGVPRGKAATAFGRGIREDPAPRAL
jgi:hypothetical protein